MHGTLIFLVNEICRKKEIQPKWHTKKERRCATATATMRRINLIFERTRKYNLIPIKKIPFQTVHSIRLLATHFAKKYTIDFYALSWRWFIIRTYIFELCVMLKMQHGIQTRANWKKKNLKNWKKYKRRKEDGFRHFSNLLCEKAEKPYNMDSD